MNKTLTATTDISQDEFNDALDFDLHLSKGQARERLVHSQ